MQTPNGSNVQFHDSFASLLNSSQHGAAMRAAGAAKDIAIVSESQRAPSQSVEATVKHGGLKR